MILNVSHFQKKIYQRSICGEEDTIVLADNTIRKIHMIKINRVTPYYISETKASAFQDYLGFDNREYL